MDQILNYSIFFKSQHKKTHRSHMDLHIQDIQQIE